MLVLGDHISSTVAVAPTQGVQWMMRSRFRPTRAWNVTKGAAPARVLLG